MGSTTLTLPTETLRDHCCQFFNQLVFSILRLNKEISKWLHITTSTFQRYVNRASESDINRKDCTNHSILDAGLIVYHTPHQLAVTTLPLPPRHRVLRLTNTDSSRLELEVVVCTEVWYFRYIDRFLLAVHFTNRGGDTLDRPFKECFSPVSIYLIDKPIFCFVKIKI